MATNEQRDFAGDATCCAEHIILCRTHGARFEGHLRKPDKQAHTTITN